MRVVLLVASLTAALVATAAHSAEVPPLQRLERFLDRVHSMRADFRQVQLNDQQQRVEESRGRMLFKRPGRFRWDYREPFERAVVADGERLWLYEADLDQVTVRPLGSGLGETPAALLTGGRDILERFEPVVSWYADDMAWVRLKPRSAESDFDSVAIGFSGERLVQIEINDRLGQRTQVFFSGISVNPRLDDKRFRFEVPPGADVIREGEI